MRILVLTNLYPNPYQPDRATFNRQQVRLLAARHPVAVIAPILWTDELAARRRGAARLPADRRATCDGIAVEHPRYVYPPKVLRDRYGHFFRGSVRRAFERALAEFRPELVFSPWAYPDGWAAVELGHRAGLPVVIKLHGSDILSLGTYPRRWRRTVEALRRADGIVAVSRDLANRAIDLGVDPSRVRVVYDGIDTSLFHPGPVAEARARLGLEAGGAAVLLFIGNLVPVKGVDILVEACAQMAAAGERFLCCVIGQGPLRDRLERQIACLGLEGRVRLLGPRPHDQLPDWYRAADLFVLPSRSEGVPVVLLEAAACSTPFVASRVGGIPEIAHLAPSRLVPPGDAGRLAEGIREALAGPLRPSTGAAAALRSHAEATAELEDLFDGVIRRTVGPSLSPSPDRPSEDPRPQAAVAHEAGRTPR
ncbi:MAG: glycosyltransferase [Isosphaeraceae bacterium]|nr:glycosyltransferase [Isosphaeraceae bacterium]